MINAMVVNARQDKERVKRVPGRAPVIIKIESTDRTIDRLVSPAETSSEWSRKGMIFGLSEKEIGIVKGKE